MFSLPKKTFHAIEAVLYIALNGSESPVSSKEIAERQNVPPRYLEQLMQKLVREGVLRGVRGPRGGYVLARERRRVTLADICSVLRDEEDTPSLSTPLALGVIMPVWKEAELRLTEALAQITVADLCARAAEKRLGKRTMDKLDFTI